MSPNGPEQRARLLSEAEIESIADRVANRTIANLFEIFGVDVTTKEGRKGLQDDLTFVRDARVGTAGVRKAGVIAIIGTIVTATALVLWKGVVAMAALAGSVK